MQPRGRFLASSIVLGVLVATIALLLAWGGIGRSVAGLLDRKAALALSLFLSLVPALALLTHRGRSLTYLLSVGCALLLVISTTFNLHVLAWMDRTAAPGSVSRLLVVLTGLVWPLISTVGAAITITGGPRQARRAGFGLTISILWIAFLLTLIWGVLPLLSGLRSPLLLVAIAGSCVFAMQTLQAECRAWWFRRSAVDTPLVVGEVVARVQSLFNVQINGPLLVERGEDFVAEIQIRPLRTPDLILSDKIGERFDPRSLAAVVAHELAHVHLGHLRQRLWASIALTIFFTAIVLSLLRANILPGIPRAPFSFLLLIAGLTVQQLVLYALIRSQEREADRYAAAMVGADAMSEALRRTSSPSTLPLDFSLWTTHEAPESRARALQQKPLQPL